MPPEILKAKVIDIDGTERWYEFYYGSLSIHSLLVG